MSKVLKLAAVLRKSGSGSNPDSSESSRVTTKIFWIVIGALASIALIFLGMNAPKLAVFIGDPVNLTTSLFFIGAVMSLFFAIPGYLNNMYLSDDLQVLLTFPYTSTQIIIAKLINVSGIIWGITFIFTLPYGISYGISGHMDGAYFLAIILAFICIPLIVMSIISIVLILIMYFAKGLRNKDTIKVIGAIVFFAIIIAIVLLSNSNQISQEKIASITDTIGGVSNILPINFALKTMMINFSLVSFLEVIAITLAITALFVFCTSKLYLSGALAIQETASVGGSINKEHMKDFCKQRSVFRAYLVKELRHVKREPAYLVQGFLYTILYPAVMLIVTAFVPGSATFMRISYVDSTAAVISWCTAVSILITFVASSTNAIACSAMSREGTDLMILKQTPVDYKVVLKAKQWASIIICSIGSTSYIVIGGILLVILGYLPWWSIFYSLVLNISLLFFCVGICMMHDIKKPNFTWESEAQMLKKCTGPGSVVMLVVGILLPIALCVVIRFLAGYAFLSMGIMIVLCVALGIIETLHLHRTGMKKIMKY